jgi:CspA family cold shock protein
VLWFSGEKGYGVIEAGGEPVYVHYTEIEGEGFRSLDEGEEVEVEISQERRGRRRAEAVRRVGKR